MKDHEKIADFFYELGQLKYVKRSGWWIAKVKDPESVAEHSFRAGMIAFVIAKIENADPCKAGMMALINDLHETRVNDLHKVGHRYINFKQAECRAIKEQLMGLPEKIGKDMMKMFIEFHAEQTKEGVIARDADLLECAIQAKEYLVTGHKDAQNWIDNIEKLLKTKSAKKIIEIIKKKDPSDWWKGLKRVER